MSYTVSILRKTWYGLRAVSCIVFVLGFACLSVSNLTADSAYWRVLGCAGVGSVVFLLAVAIFGPRKKDGVVPVVGHASAQYPIGGPRGQ